MSTMPLILSKKIVKDSYSWTQQAAFIRTEMEVGPMRQRRRTTSMPTTLSFKMILTRQELAVLEAWYKYKIENGAAWFLMPLVTGTDKSYPSVRFTEPYSVSLSAIDTYEVSCETEIDEMPLMTEEELEQYLE